MLLNRGEHLARYRKNAAAVIINDAGYVLLANRIDGAGWQFPQGGVDEGENSTQAVYREVYEEVGIESKNLNLIAYTANFLCYTIPPFKREWWQRMQNIKGQRQRWFLLSLQGDDSAINLQASDHPEFDKWQWVPYWYPLHKVISFKSDVYRQGLTLLRNPYVRHLESAGG